MSSAALPIAVQLYSLRKMTEPFDTVLGQVAAAGYAGVETIGDHGLSAAAMNDLLQKHNLKVISTHVQYKALIEKFDAIVAFNQAIGNTVITLPVPPERPTEAAGWRLLGALFDALGARLADKGMKLLYHNHNFEMVAYDGALALTWMLDAAKPEHLGWEPDLAWIVRGQADPLALLKQYAGRCLRIHAKDLAPAGTGEDEMGFADVGHGTLDWNALLPASKAAGGEWFIVEHDLPNDPIRTITRSYNFLRSKSALI
jgi:sugar phosphate isomerase/epimerase